MLQNRDIIVFGDDWGKYPSTMQHMGRILAKYNRLLWIGSLGLRKPEFKLYDLKRVLEKGKNVLRKSKQTSSCSNVHEVQPFVLPFHDSKLVRRINGKLLRAALIKQIEALNFQRPILISSSPLIADVIGSINETSSHYICLDDWGEFEGAFRCLNEVEQELLKKVDSCFAVSETLLTERKSAKGENHFLPQGVDVDHFSKSEDSVPPELRSLPKPIIGYFGLFATYVNFEMIIESARAYPTASVVLFGRTKTDISRLLEEPNIHFLGEIPFSNLPRYASAFDVGLIPFTVNKLTIAANPLKLLEYLSLGIPVVSTELPEVMKFQDVVFIAKDTNDFVRCVGKALAEDTLEQNERRRNQAEKFSWRAIVEEFSNIVLRIEETKNSIRSS